MIEKILLKDLVSKPISGEWGNDGGEIKVLRTTNFTNEGKIDYSNVVLRDIDERKVVSKRLIPGDIIVEKSGGSPTQPVGRVVLFDNEGLFLCNNFTSILRPKSEIIFPKYLLYILYANHQYGFTGGFQNKTTGIINLQLSRYVEKTKIPLPPLDQQKKIAAILDAADGYRQKTKALIEKYDELTQSLFLDMFGDPVTNSKNLNIQKGTDLFKFSSGKYNPTKNLSDDFEFPTYGGNGITGFSEKYLIDYDTIVIGRVGAYCGSIHQTKGKTWVTDNAIFIKEFKKEINLTYAYYFFKGYKLNRFADFSGQPKITQKPLENMNFVHPKIELQNQFAERVQAIEAQKALAQKELEKSEELFNSLLQKAFKGELV